MVSPNPPDDKNDPPHPAVPTESSIWAGPIVYLPLVIVALLAVGFIVYLGFAT